MPRVLCLLTILLLLVTPAWSQERGISKASPDLGTQKRLALVIGNSDYQHTSPLRNPANDARAMSQTLLELGFEVTALVDADQRQMEEATRQFGKDLRDQKGVGLFYYAGHGMQVDGENYLLPVDIDPSNEIDVRYDAFPVGKLLGQMQVAENGMNIVVLDACRNNPFKRSFRTASQGLAQVIAPTGTFISYATAPGSVAADGEGQNGLFTEKLLQHMVTPGLGLEKVFKRVRADVQRDSNSQQVPWDSSSVTGDFFFVPAGSTAQLSSPVAPNRPSQDLSSQAWKLIEDSDNPAVFQAFIRKFPNSPERELAELKLMLLSPAEAAQTEAPASSSTAKAKEERLTVTDSETGLMWQRGEPGEMNWEAAKSYCQNLSLAGYTDWQLPDKETLQQMFAYSKGGHYSEAELRRMFPGIHSSYYWSSATYVRYTSVAWGVSFSSGSVGNDLKGLNYYVRCVRDSK
jgi:hypothetical protein